MTAKQQQITAGFGKMAGSVLNSAAVLRLNFCASIFATSPGCKTVGCYFLRKAPGMTKHIIITIIVSFFATNTYSQNETTSDIFERISKGVKEFKLDTTAAPDDKMTRKIIELRNLRGGFNINEAIDFKIEEDRQKNEVPKEELDKLSTFFKSGNGKRWLDNAVIRIYRNNFTYRELKQLVKFYKTSAGQKIATNFPVIMMQSLRAAEMIKELYVQQKK